MGTIYLYGLIITLIVYLIYYAPMFREEWKASADQMGLILTDTVMFSLLVAAWPITVPVLIWLIYVDVRAKGSRHET